MGKDSIIVLGGDGNEHFEKSIRKGIYKKFQETKQLKRFINVDLAPVVPNIENRYAIPHKLIEYIISALKDVGTGAIVTPASIMPVGNDSTVEFIFEKLEESFTKNVSIGMKHRSVPTVFTSDYDGLKEMIDHMINHHNYKKIAYVSGPSEYDDAVERNSAYTETMAKYGLDKYISPGNFTPEGGANAVKKFKTDGILHSLDAILCADDDTASGVIQELSSLGLNVPEDIAVAGFDNSHRAQLLGITSVDPQIEAQGEAALDIVLSHRGSSVIPSHISKNRSCGCSPFNSKFIDRDDSSVGVEFNLGDIYSKLRSLTGSEDISRLIYNYLDQENLTIDELSTKLFSLLENYEDLDKLENSIRESIDRYLGSVVESSAPKLLYKIINLYHFLPKLFNKVELYKQSKEILEEEELKEDLVDFRSEIISSSDLPSLLESVKTIVEDLEIKTFYLTLFEDSTDSYSFSNKVEENLKCVLKGNNGSYFSYNSVGDSCSKVIKGIVNEIDDETVSIIPLYFEKNYGIIIIGETSSDIVHALHDSISIALEKIRNGEEKSIKNRLLSENRETIIGMVEPLIGMARSLADYIFEKKGDLITKLNVSSDTSINTINKSSQAVAYVNDQLSTIVNLVKGIDDITERTEVLSINASIEAARAGEAGRGFKVIAGEIKKLSEAQSIESGKVNMHIKDAESAMKNSIQAGTENLEAIDNVKVQITEAINFFEEIEHNLEKIITSGGSVIQEIKHQNIEFSKV